MSLNKELLNIDTRNVVDAMSKNVKVLAVKYGNSRDQDKVYHFKAPASWDVKAGDLVVVPSVYGFARSVAKVEKITTVEKSKKAYKGEMQWASSLVNEEETQALQEAEMILAEAIETAKEDFMRNQFMTMLDTTLSSSNEFKAALNILAGNKE